MNRLNIKPLKPINIGISAQEKGILLHKGLEYIGELLINNIKVEQSPDKHLLKCAQGLQKKGYALLGNYRSKATEQLLKLEVLILINKIKAALQEGLPSNISYVEKEIAIKIKDYYFQVRIDRIDELNGQWLIVDYKKTSPSSAKWFGDRPDDLQLPSDVHSRPSLNQALVDSLN